MDTSERRHLAVAAAVWPLSLAVLLVGAFAPVDDDFQLEAFWGEWTNGGWAGGLGAAALLLAILLGLIAFSWIVYLYAWVCLLLAAWVGLAFNVGSPRGGAIGLVVLVVLLLIPMWMIGHDAVQERQAHSDSGGRLPEVTVPMSDDDLARLHEGVQHEIDLRRSRGAPSREIAQLEDLLDQIEEQRRQLT